MKKTNIYQNQSQQLLHSKCVWERFATAIKIDRIPLFDVSRHCHGVGVIGRSMLDVRCSTFNLFYSFGRVKFHKRCQEEGSENEKRNDYNNI